MKDFVKVKMVLHCELPTDYSESEFDEAVKQTIYDMGGKVIESEEYQEDDLYSDEGIDIKPEFYYYKLHIFGCGAIGYYVFFKTEKKLDGYDNIVDEALELIENFMMVWKNCDFAQQIDKEEYDDGIGLKDIYRKNGLDIVYQLYKTQWCRERGYNLEDIDEELGINGECYVCEEEFRNNEFQDAEYVKNLLNFYLYPSNN